MAYISPQHVSMDAFLFLGAASAGELQSDLEIRDDLI